MIWGRTVKPRWRSLRRGERIWAVIEDILEQQEVIVNFGGDLLRVGNESHRILRPGQRVLLQVTDTAPFRFRLMSLSDLTRSLRPSLDINI